MRRIIESLGGIGTFGVISVCLFVALFGGSLIWAFRQKKPFLDSMGTLPLQDAPSEKPAANQEKEACDAGPGLKGDTRHE
jgi:hypothetical protein